MDAIPSTTPIPVSSHGSVRDDLLGRMRGASGPYLAGVAVCGMIVAWALFAWGYQIVNGFGNTGVRRPVYWGFYIVNFVFWIGISHAGTLISAILRLTGAEWRKPVTRAAEAITVFCLMIGGLFPLIHISRPWFFYWMLPYPNERLLWPNFRSPLFWDLTAILTYLVGQRHLSLPAADPGSGRAGEGTAKERSAASIGPCRSDGQARTGNGRPWSGP